MVIRACWRRLGVLLNSELPSDGISENIGASRPKIGGVVILPRWRLAVSVTTGFLLVGGGAVEFLVLTSGSRKVLKIEHLFGSTIIVAESNSVENFNCAVILFTVRRLFGGVAFAS